MGMPIKTSNEEPEIQDSISRLEAKLTRALEELEKARKEKIELEKHFQEVVSSRSWKMTEPLRRFTLARKTIFPLFRSRTVKASVVPKRSLLQSGCNFKINGASPCLSIDLAGASCPQGWILVEALVETIKGTLFFYLYMGREGGFSDSERFLLSFDDKEVERHPIFIPDGITDLRLDVYDFDGDFNLKDLSLKELGSLQFLWSVLSKTVLPLRKDPKALLIKAKRGIAVWREGGLWALRSKLIGSRVTNNYAEWVSRFDSFAENDKGRIEEASLKLKVKPKISIVTPVFNPPIVHFRACLDSVVNQGYSDWELCLADDGSSDPQVRTVIEEYRTKDPRIKVIYRDKTGHISNASNSALSLASGEYIAFLDHDDELTVDALYLMAYEINKFPDSGLLYSDEDKKTGYGMRVNPHFKSDWNPELLLQQNYVCHFCVVKKSLVDLVGGFRSEFDGAQDWDLILRVSEKLEPAQIRHIPHVLYHWKIIEGSTAQSTSAKPYVLEAQRKAVQGHLDRTNQDAIASIRHSISNLSVERRIPNPAPMVSIIILTKDKVELLSRCVDSIVEKTNYQNYEIIIVDNGSIDKETREYFEEIGELSNLTIINDDRRFNFSALNNLATKIAKGDIFAFLNNDLEVIEPKWLDLMVGQAIRSKVGAVGAKLLFPNNLVQHAGVIIGIGGVAGHNHKGRLRDDPGYFNRIILSQNLSAVTAACMLVPKDVFAAVDGFDETLSVAFNDVDLCLRIREAGFQIVYEPQAELYHYESASRGYENTSEKFQRFEEEIERMKKRWGKALLSDPYYNPNLTNLSEDFVFAFPPRVTRPWKA